MSRPATLVCAGRELFNSFFPVLHAKRLSELCDWRLDGSRDIRKLRKKLATAEVLITTWDSPKFSDDLAQLGPKLRLISHCGGEVKSRFARGLFERITITNAANPMARATAHGISTTIATESGDARTAFTRRYTCMEMLKASPAAKLR